MAVWQPVWQPRLPLTNPCISLQSWMGHRADDSGNSCDHWRNPSYGHPSLHHCCPVLLSAPGQSPEPLSRGHQQTTCPLWGQKLEVLFEVTKPKAMECGRHKSRGLGVGGVTRRELCIPHTLHTSEHPKRACWEDGARYVVCPARLRFQSWKGPAPFSEDPESWPQPPAAPSSM